MAITTLDGVVAGYQLPRSFFKVSTAHENIGIHHSLMYLTGMPGAAVVPTPGLAGAALTSYAGCLTRTNPASGNAYLGRLAAAASSAGTAILYDRLWHNSGLVVGTTTAQTINSVAWPARDRDGTTNGEDILVGIEFSTASSAAAITNTTMSYTNQAGTAGKTATISSVPATPTANTFVPFQLAAGDTGIRSIQSVTLGTAYTGAVLHLVAYRQLARVELPVAGVGDSVDVVTSGMPRIYNDSVLQFLYIPSVTTTTVSFHAQIIETHG